MFHLFSLASKEKEKESDERKEERADDDPSVDAATKALLNQTAESHLKEVSKRRDKMADRGLNKPFFMISNCLIASLVCPEFDPRTRDHFLYERLSKSIPQYRPDEVISNTGAHMSDLS